MRPRSARECNMTHARTHARVLMHACTHARMATCTRVTRDRACAIAVLSPRANHPPARPSAPTLDARRIQRAPLALPVRASGRQTRKGEEAEGSEREREREDRRVGGGSREGGTAERRGTENASATARILTRVARGPNSVTMRAARGIPRNTLNTSSSQKTNETTRPLSLSLSLGFCLALYRSFPHADRFARVLAYHPACPNRPDALVSALASHPAAATALAAKCRANVRERRNRGIRGSGTITSRMETRAAAERNNVDSPSANPDDAGNPVISAAPLRRARSYLARRAKAGYELRREERPGGREVARSVDRPESARYRLATRTESVLFLYFLYPS